MTPDQTTAKVTLEKQHGDKFLHEKAVKLDEFAMTLFILALHNAILKVDKQL